MAAALTIVDSTLAFLASRLVVNAERALAERLTTFRSLSDVEVRHACRVRATARAAVGEPTQNRRFPLLALLRPHLSTSLLDDLALGIEAFRRAPADLPDGSQLYPQQHQAAVALLQECLVQMDTGEGKTYVCPPVAFALLGKFRRVYVLAANQYLAERDAVRTQRFWQFTGIPASCASFYGPDSYWQYPVVYTTLEDFNYHYMAQALGARRTPLSLSDSAVIVDEADAVLLDQGDQEMQYVRSVSRASFDWTPYLEIADRLGPAHVTEDWQSYDACLTPEGEDLLSVELKRRAINAEYLVARLATEDSYVGARMVKPDVDYIVEGERIVMIDRVTGRADRTRTWGWMPPLECKLGFPSRPERQVLDEVSPGRLLRSTGFLSGLSGTLQSDATEYLFSYRRPCVVVPPRRPRETGHEDDAVFMSSVGARAAAVESVLQALSDGRPVLLGCQNIPDAEAVYRALVSKVSPQVAVHLLTAKDDAETAAIFERAGEVNTVVVATQLAGRGIDIRLSNECRARGGLVLICLGHALTLRHDRQFLGRAGRQGDPFKAQFVCALDDPLIVLAGGERTQRIMKTMGMSDSEPIVHSWITRSIRRAQESLARAAFYRRRHAELVGRLLHLVRRDFTTWIEAVQYDEMEEEDPYLESKRGAAFLNLILSRFIDHHVRDAWSRRSLVEREHEHKIFDSLLRESPLEFDRKTLPRLVGRTIPEARQVLYDKFKAALAEAFRANRLSVDDAAADDGNLDKRRPRNVALASMKWVWNEFLDVKSQLLHELQQLDFSSIEYTRRAALMTCAEWYASEQRLIDATVWNLLLTASPRHLDHLFPEATADIGRRLPGLGAVSMPSAVFGNTLTAGETLPDLEKLVRQFVPQVAPADREALTLRFLHRFLAGRDGEGLFEALREPGGPEREFDRWKDTLAADPALSRGDRRLGRRLIRLFLAYLASKGLAAQTPGVRLKIGAGLSALLTLGRVAIGPAIGVAAAVALFMLLRVSADRVTVPRPLPPLMRLLDDLLLGQTIQGGRLLLIGLCAASVVEIVRYVTGQSDRGYRGTPIDRALCVLTIVGLGAYLIRWSLHVPLLPPGVAPLLLLITVGLMSRLLVAAMWMLRNQFGFRVVSAWLGVNVLVYVLPAAAGAGAPSWMVLPEALAIAALLWLARRVGRVRLTVRSVYVRSRAQMAHKITDSALVIRDLSRMRIHGLGVAIAAVIGVKTSAMTAMFGLELSESARGWLPVAGYALTMLIMTTAGLAARLDPASWRRRLRQRRQEIREASGPATLETVLRGAFLRTWTPSVVALTGLIMAAHALAPRPVEGLPLSQGLLIFFAGGVLVTVLDHLHHDILGVVSIGARGGELTEDMLLEKSVASGQYVRRSVRWKAIGAKVWQAAMVLSVLVSLGQGVRDGAMLVSSPRTTPPATQPRPAAPPDRGERALHWVLRHWYLGGGVLLVVFLARKHRSRRVALPEAGVRGVKREQIRIDRASDPTFDAGSRERIAGLFLPTGPTHKSSTPPDDPAST